MLNPGYSPRHLRRLNIRRTSGAGHRVCTRYSASDRAGHRRRPTASFGPASYSFRLATPLRLQELLPCCYLAVTRAFAESAEAIRAYFYCERAAGVCPRQRNSLVAMMER